MMAPPTETGVYIRPSEGRDLERVVAIANATDPDGASTVEEVRREDALWDGARYFRLRLVAEDVRGEVVGSGEVSHRPRWFHPHHYHLDVRVDPARQRRGIGTRLFARLLAALRRREAVLVRAEAPESAAAAVAFLTRRGFREVQRIWESRLDVTRFDLARFAGAEERAAAQGIVITTLGAEVARDRAGALRRLYALHAACRRDVPALDPPTDEPYEDFLAWWETVGLVAPTYLPDGYLIAKDAGRWVGESALWDNRDEPDALDQGMTGVVRAYRGRGIAMALKVRGVRLARALGKRRIRTGNDSLNAPMLRINDAMGFRRESARLTFEQRLVTLPDASCCR
jgi:ribosomal protein S18 acetylase RimI-like enzyme